MKIYKNLFFFALGNFLTWGSYYGFIHLGYQGFENVMLLVSWFSAITGTLMLFFENGKLDIKPSKVWISAIDRLLDLSFALVLAYEGYLVLSVFYILHILGISKHKDHARKTLDKK